MKTVLLPNFYVGLLAFVEAGGSFFLGCKTLGWNEVTFEHIYVQEGKIAMSAGSRCTWFCVLVLNGGGYVDQGGLLFYLGAFINYSHLSNKRGGGSKVAKSINVEVGIL